MKRDVDLARTILFAIEEKQRTSPQSLQLVIPDRLVEEVRYHIMLLAESGFIEAENVSVESKDNWCPKCLTKLGQKFLDLARSDQAWAQAKENTLKERHGLSLYLLWNELKALQEQAQARISHEGN